MSEDELLPGGALTNRPLHFIWLADCSGSMAGEKINQLNFAIRDAIPEMKRVADDNPNAQVLIRAISFESNAKWHIANPTPLDQFQWIDLQVGGLTSMGAALKLVSKELTSDKMGSRALPPVLVLISDGEPTDDFQKALDEMMQSPWAKKAVRISIAIGDQANLDILQKFIGHSELKPLVAQTAAQLAQYIRWVSTTVLQSASSPATQTRNNAIPQTNVPLNSPPPQPDPNINPLDVF